MNKAMKFIGGLAAGIMLTGLLAQTAIAGEKAKGSNLIKNGGFEVDAEKWQPGQAPKGWSNQWKAKGTKGKFELDDTVKYSGGYSLKCSGTGPGGIGIYQRFKVKPGERYNVSCYVKTKLGNGGCGFSVRWLNAKGKTVMREAYPKEKGKSWVRNGKVQITYNGNTYGLHDWTKVEHKALRAPETAVRAQVGIGTIYKFRFKEKDAFWVDNVVAERVIAEKTTGKNRSLTTAGKTDTPPVIDGKLNDAVWENAAEATHFSIPQLSALANEQTVVKLAYDNRALYLGIRCEEPSPDKLKMRVKQRDGMVYNDDCVEIFLAPQAKAGKKQYQFLVNPAGVYDDISEVWDKEGTCKLDFEWNPDCKIAASVGKDAWTVEMEIPFAELGVKCPADPDTWGFNVIRDRRSTETEQSSWNLTPIKGLQFQNPKGFGRLMFADKTAAVKSCIVSRRKASFSVFNPSDRKIPVRVRVEQKEGTSLYPLGEETIILAPNRMKQVSISIAKPVAGLLWVSASSAGKEVFRDGFIPGSSYAAIGWRDPGNVLGNQLHVASDIRSFHCFNMRHNFKNAGPHGLMFRGKKPVDLYFELPQEIKAISLVTYVNNWMHLSPVSPSREEPFVRNNQEYVRYKFELPCVMSYVNFMAVIFETSLSPGEQREGSCYLKWKEGQQAVRPLDIKVIEIGKTKPLKRFFNGMFYAPPEFLLTWLPELGRDLPRLGMNRVEIAPNVEGASAQGGPRNLRKVSRREWFDRLVAECKKGGLYMTTAGSQSTPYFQGWTTYRNCDPDARAIAVNGKPVMDSRWASCYSLCPFYRGRKFQEYINMLKDSPAFQEYGLNWLTVDLELWNRKAWKEGCYCDRCMKEFRLFAAEKYPGKKIGDPKQFMQSPENHPEEHEIWKEFRKWSKVKFISDIISPLKAVVAKHGSQTGPKPGLIVSEWHFPIPGMFDLVDYFEINLYHRPPNVVKRIAKARKLSGNRRNIVATPSCGQTPGCADSNLKPEEIRYNIFECAVGGVEGIIWLDAMSCNTLKLKMMVDGIRAIQPFEDIMLDGTCRLELPCKGKGASARGIVLGSEALAVVRAYENNEKVNAKVTLPCTGKSVVYDCYTNTLLGSVTPANPQITVPITTERARLLYVGPDAKWRKRQ